MKLQNQISVSGSVEHFLAFTACGNEACILEYAEMVGNSRAAHIDSGCNIENAVFCVTEKPENSEAAWVSELLHCVGHSLDSLVIRKVTDNLFA